MSIINPVINSVFAAHAIFPHLFCSAFVEYISKGPRDLAVGVRAKTEPVQPLPAGVHGERPRPAIPELLTRPDPDPHLLADAPTRP